MQEFRLDDCVKENLSRNVQRTSHGLNLVLVLANKLRMPEMLLRIQAAQPNIRRALTELNFVHFARFLPTRDGSALQVITEFDGPLEPYVMDFAIAIGEEFSMMLSFVADAPPLPVKNHPDEFWEFVKRNNRVHILGQPLPESLDYPLYSAYPELTVLDIVGKRQQLPPPAADRPSATIDHADVQGNILRGYRAYYARHFVLEINNARKAGQWLAALASGPQAGVPAITSNVDWGAVPPTVMLNVGLTFNGLTAMGLDDDELAAFPTAYREGPAHEPRASANGDTAASRPGDWRLGKPGDPAHVMLSLYAFLGNESNFASAGTAIEAALAGAGLRLLSTHDAKALGTDLVKRNQIYFGYQDGVAQPRITDPCAVPNDLQPAASPGEFLLHPDYADIFGGPSIGALPPTIARNGSFCAVRLLEQHVGAFEQLLKDGAAALSVSAELVAAKLMGRWRDGTPLVLFPDDASKAGATSADATRNDFDYAPSYEYPATPNDHEGLRCPVGAHIRRTNPRTARVAGARYSRRLIRRGMPYDTAQGEQGLFGLFFCGSLERQFEFIQQQWINGDLFASGIRGTQDAIVGAQTLSGTLTLPGMGPGGTNAHLKVPRLTTTRGSLYLFMPGLGALRHLREVVTFSPEFMGPNTPIESLGGVLRKRVAVELTRPVARQIADAFFAPRPTAVGSIQQLVPGSVGFDPNAFDPTDLAFLANPYPSFAAFRAAYPVYYIPKHEAYWVFSHGLVMEMFTRTPDFLKRPPGDTQIRGLFTMEAKRHATVRPWLDVAFYVAMSQARRYADQATTQALDAVDNQCFDVVGQFASRVSAQVLFDVMGIPADERDKVDKRARTVMHYAARRSASCNV
jgi:deferrochelatase/peroxidase EfeB